MMAAKVEEFPFTSAQWQELETQTMIFNHLISTSPQPPHLHLFSNTRNFLFPGYPFPYQKINDLEPGRCRRTDGKKWRCSKEAEVNHKYCEKHSHRARPRSRKPVEEEVRVADDENNNRKMKMVKKKKTRVRDDSVFTAVAEQTAQVNKFAAHQMVERQVIQPNRSFPFSVNANTNRERGWMMEDKMLATDGVEQEWSHLMDTKIALASERSIFDHNAPLFQQNYGVEPLNLFSSTDLAAPGDFHHNYESQFFLNSDMASLDKQPQMDHPRGFVDAWSNDTFKTTATANANDASLSSSLAPTEEKSCIHPWSRTLSMAMAADNSLDEEMVKIQEGNGLGKDNNEMKSQDSTWVSPLSWVPFTRGGPLAEVLRSGSISTPASNVSSPSGVLHRALFSQSDTSVCNSPVLPPPEVRNEFVGFKWRN